MRSHTDPKVIFENFKHNVETLLRANNMTRVELSHRAGFQNEDEIADALSGSDIPNMALPVQVAEALGVEVGDLFQPPVSYDDRHNIEVVPVREIDRKASQLMTAMLRSAHRAMEGLGQKPTMDSILSWWKETGGKLVDCDTLLPHFDLVKVPPLNATSLSVEHVGGEGLSAMTLGTDEPSQLEKFMRTLNDADLEELQKTIRTVSYTKMGCVTPQTRLVTLPGSSFATQVSFVRLMLPVEDEAGNPFVLNYSTLISESSPNSKSGFDA